MHAEAVSKIFLKAENVLNSAEENPLETKRAADVCSNSTPAIENPHQNSARLLNRAKCQRMSSRRLVALFRSVRFELDHEGLRSGFQRDLSEKLFKGGLKGGLRRALKGGLRRGFKGGLRRGDLEFSKGALRGLPSLEGASRGAF